jgi:type I restriction enzyme, S subunit
MIERIPLLSDLKIGPFKSTRLRILISDRCFQNGLYKPSSSYGRGIQIIRISDFDNDGYMVSDSFSRVEVSARELEQFAVIKNDILINRVNSISHIGKAILIGQSLTSIVYESNMMRLRLPKESLVAPEYLALVLQAHSTRSYFKKIARPAVAQVSINQGDVLSIPIIVYPKSMQMHACKVIKEWDTAIQKIEKLIVGKQARYKSLMQRLLTGKQRLEAYNRPWRTVRLREIFTNRVEDNRPDLPLVAITGENGVVRRDALARRDTSTENKSRYLRICPGDIGYNTMRMWQGVCGLSRLEGIVSPAYTIVTPVDRVDGEFMAFFFKYPAVIHLLFRHSQGLVDDTLNLKWRHFAEIEVTIPDKTEQQAIAAIFRDSSREMDLLRKQLEALRLQKRGLMQKLLTGEWPVKADASEVNP